ncbi:hypothetical protein F5Y06DRAFT_298214 [Hypoxylon sp. FL0890]|nr:hypothetical protein F5Y06DRAFT_298214 [Hypoxylon sp. FL0890]
MQSLLGNNWWNAREARIRERWRISKKPAENSPVPECDLQNNEDAAHPVADSNAIVTAPPQGHPTREVHTTNENVVITDDRVIGLDLPEDMDTDPGGDTYQARRSTIDVEDEDGKAHPELANSPPSDMGFYNWHTADDRWWLLS